MYFQVKSNKKELNTLTIYFISVFSLFFLLFTLHYLEPHLDWLERRLQGIPIYTANCQQVETYNLAAKDVSEIKTTVNCFKH